MCPNVIKYFRRRRHIYFAGGARFFFVEAQIRLICWPPITNHTWEQIRKLKQVLHAVEMFQMNGAGKSEKSLSDPFVLFKKTWYEIMISWFQELYGNDYFLNILHKLQRGPVGHLLDDCFADNEFSIGEEAIVGMFLSRSLQCGLIHKKPLQVTKALEMPKKG